MKDATFFLLVCILSDIQYKNNFFLKIMTVIMGAAIHFTIKRVSYDSMIISHFSNPLELQGPGFYKKLHKTCSWIPITGIIFPGMFINYMKRVDNSELRNRNSYRSVITTIISFSINI